MVYNLHDKIHTSCQMMFVTDDLYLRDIVLIDFVRWLVSDVWLIFIIQAFCQWFYPGFGLVARSLTSLSTKAHLHSGFDRSYYWLPWGLFSIAYVAWSAYLVH